MSVQQRIGRLRRFYLVSVTVALSIAAAEAWAIRSTAVLLLLVALGLLGWLVGTWLGVPYQQRKLQEWAQGVREPDPWGWSARLIFVGSLVLVEVTGYLFGLDAIDFALASLSAYLAPAVFVLWLNLPGVGSQVGEADRPTDPGRQEKVRRGKRGGVRRR